MLKAKTPQRYGMRRVKPRSWIVGGSVAVVLGLAAATWFTAADWQLNPGGIFRDGNGTRWDVVLETALSWFLPVALIFFILATAAHHWLSPTGGQQ